jgi:glycosyltransferase involved in cell wall biosynthesis
MCTGCWPIDGGVRIFDPKDLNLETPISFDVAITSYKRPALAEAAVRSCLKQGPFLRRVIVVDDASGDGTVAQLRALGDPRVFVHERTTNGGIAAARRDAFAHSDADWTVSLDSDHELLPNALEKLATLAHSNAVTADILGARYRWDTGEITPKVLPVGKVGYRERILYASRRDSIGCDYLCSVSRRVRARVKWEPLRSIGPDTLFQLDLAKAGDAIFTSDALALQKSCLENSWTRGVATTRWERRTRDASDGLDCMRLTLDRHGEALRKWGRPMLSDMLAVGCFYSVLVGSRRDALRLGWSALALFRSRLALSAAMLSLCPRVFVEMAYRLRG